MPTLTLPNAFASGDTSSATKVSENLYAANHTTPDSLEIINGHLEDDNLVSGFTPDADQFQFDGLSDASIRASTRSIDWPLAIFTDDAGESSAQTVPGCSRSIYVRKAQGILVVKYGLLACTGDDEDEDASIWLSYLSPTGTGHFTRVTSTIREVPRFHTSGGVYWTRHIRGTYMIKNPTVGTWHFAVRLKRTSAATEASTIKTGWRNMTVRHYL